MAVTHLFLGDDPHLLQDLMVMCNDFGRIGHNDTGTPP
jgi:hypothetical protein